MKTGLGIQRKFKALHAYINLLRFRFLEIMLGFDSANVFLQSLEKNSLLLVLKRNGAVIGSDCDIETGLVFHNCENYSNLIVGNNCHIGKNCFFDLRGKVVIEDNVVISMKSTFITHQDLNNSRLKVLMPAEKNGIIVGNDSYVGANSTILQGVEIHSCSVVAAGAMVTKDVPERTMVGGVPARVIKKIKLS